MGPDGYEPGSGGDGGSGHIEDPTKRVQKKLLASLADAAGAKVIPKDLVTLQDALPGRVTQSPSPIFDALTSERNVAEQPVSQNSPQNSPQERTSPAPRTIDEQMWDSGSGGTRQERATPVKEKPVDQVGSSVVSTPTPEDERSLLQKGIQHAREIMAREIEKWNALPEVERTTKIENILTRFEKFTENGVLKREGKDPKLGLFHKLAAQIAEIIEKDVIPGIEPFTKGVLILAFTDMAMPPRISILLTKYIGDLLSGRIENNAQRAVDRLRTFSGAIENIQAETPAEEGFLGRLKQKIKDELEKLKSVETGEENVAASDGATMEASDGTTVEDEASNPDGSAEDAASTLGDETVGDDPEEGAEAEVGKDAEDAPQVASAVAGTDESGSPVSSEAATPTSTTSKDPSMRRKSDADLVAGAHARLASRDVDFANGNDTNPPIDPPIELRSMDSEREPSSQGDPYYLERYDVSSELEQWLYHYQTMLSRQLEGTGNLDEDKIRQIEEESTIRAKSKIEELYGMRAVNQVEIAGRRISYIQYNVLNREECNFFGKDSLSIVVRLHLAGLLGDFTDEEIDVIRSFDSRYLHEVGTPELFQLKIGKMLKRAQDVDVLGNPNGPEIVKKRFQNEYEAYKSTLMELMYTLISGKVEGVDTDEASVKLSASIKKRLGELKAITKEQSFESLDYMPENLKVTVTRRVTVPNSIDNQDPQGAKVGRTMYVEHHEDVSISKAISEDLLPTLEKIESTVGYANLLRNTTHDRSKKMEDVATAALHADLTSIPDAIAFNPYLQVAMQEYVCALGQVVAEVNNIPYSNFGALNQSGLETAEQLTIDSLMIQFPMRPLPLTEEQIEAKAAEKVANIKSLAMSMSDDTNQAGQMVGDRRNLGRNHSRGGVVKVRPNELQIQIQLLKNEETRKKKRYENDIELAVKVASGLHKGIGEFWTVLDAGISNEMLTATVRKDGQVDRARTFADSNSPVLDKLGKMKPFEAMRFGKDAGFGLIGVGAARYPGERLESTRWSKLGKLAYDWDLFDSQRFQEESLRRYGADKRSRKKPDETSHTEFLLLAKDMTRADRHGMSEELGEFYKNFLGVHQLMHKIPGDIPRSGGWRIDNNDSIDQKFTATFLNEATSQVPPLAGLELHEYVMDRLRSLGGERLVVHYIGKNVDKLMELDTDDGSVLTKYNEVKARIVSAIKDGSHAAQDEKSEDEVELERLAPLLMRQRDNVRIKYLQKYVFEPLLKRRPELALICERKGLTPVGERTMREQLVDFIRMSPQFIEGSQDRNAYAVLEQCLPAFEVATRVVKRNSHLSDNGEFDQGIRKYFKDVLERSQSVQILSGDNQPRATQFTPLKELLVGVDIDNKLDSMMSLFEDYIHQVEQIGSQTKLAQRFSEHVVYETGNAGACITSPGGFDYSRIQFDGMNTLKSAISGIEGNIALKAQLEALETKLLGLYTTGLDELKTTAQYKAVVDNLFDTLNAYAESMSGNPDEANIYFGRLAQIAVFSLREPVPGKNMKSIWTVGDTDQSGKGLNAEQRYNLLKALLRRRGVPDQLCILDQENMDEINPTYRSLIQNLENIPDDDGYIRTKTGFGKLAALVVGPKAPSSREKAASRIRKMRIFRGPAKTFSATSGMFLDGVSVSSSAMEQKYKNAEAKRESRPAAE